MDDRSMELERRVGAELVARGIVHPAGLAPLHAEGRARGLARGGSFLAGAVVARGLAPPAAIDAVLEHIVRSSRPDATWGPAPGMSRSGEHRTVAAPTVSGPPPAAATPSGSVGAGPTWSQGLRYTLPAQLVDGPQPAIDRRLGRDVMLHADADGSDAGPVHRAARALARLDHPSIPRVHDLGTLGDRAYYTTDPLPGATLDAAKGAALPALLRAFLDVGAAVTHAHRAGVVHGDLWPSRVVLGESGEAWVTGWGEVAGAAAPKDDVRGLGRVLEGVLAASRAPAPLRAVARQALREQGGAYARVEEVVEDVRRYLDGEGVVAEPESLPRALARLARRHPGPAGVALVIGLALLAIGALAARGLGAATLALGDAVEAAQRAEAEAQAALGLAEQRSAAARASGAAAATKLRIEDALARAQAADLAAIGSAYDEAEREARALAGADRAEARARIRTRRARFLLEVSRSEDALAALADDPGEPPLAGEEVELLRFLAARRAAGEGTDATRDRALGALAAGPDGAPLAEVARALVALPPLEVERAFIGGPTPPSEQPKSPALAAVHARAAPLVKRLEAAVAARPDVALAHEALGRALAAGDDPIRGATCFVTATQLDPADPAPRLAFVETWLREFRGHDRRRWIIGWSLRQLRAATRLTRRPEPLLALSRLCVSVEDRARAEGAASDLLALPRPATGAAAWDEASLVVARGRLGRNEDPGDLLTRLAPGPGVDRSRLEALLAWSEMRRGQTEVARAHAVAALESLKEADVVAVRDVVMAIAYSPIVLPVDFYDPLLAALDRAPVADKVFMQELVLMARARGISTGGGDDNLEQHRESNLSGSFCAAEAELAMGRVYYAMPGFAPHATLEGLLAWAQVGLDRADLSTTAYDAKEFVIFCLRQAGQHEAAARFTAIDQLEPTAPRSWSPPSTGPRGQPR